ncbi:MBL fold metallo-hydrolase [Candidatus Gracilibacteria bacterium]|nr:MBL fold metallo-hydrolase [Candidatus Gracilibacteria bacterium]
MPPVSITTASGVRVHGIQTGYVAIKSAHAMLRRPAAVRLLSIVADTTWTPLLPILAWVIEHPEGLIVVDTGELAAASDIDSYMAADPGNRWVYKRNIGLYVSAAEELAAQMRGLGLDPEAVRTVVMTHLHGDHAGGLSFFPNATFLVARAEYEGICACRSARWLRFGPQVGSRNSSSTTMGRLAPFSPADVSRVRAMCCCYPRRAIATAINRCCSALVSARILLLATWLSARHSY